MSDSTLKPCPFCGNRARLYGDDYRWYWVECNCCHCKVGYEETAEQGVGHIDSGRFRTAAEAIAAWNARVERTCTMEDTTHPANDDVWSTAKCSECETNFTTDFVHLNYCPNCGARVEAEE